MDTDGHLIDAHCEALRRLGRRPGTIDQRRYHLRRLATDAGPLLDVGLDALRTWCHAPRLGAESRAARVSHVRGFYAWAAREGLTDTDRSIGVARPRRARHLPRPIPDERLRRALAWSAFPERAWLHLAALGGLRCCEIAPLRGEDYEATRLRLTGTKGGGESAIPVSERLAAILDPLPRTGWWWPAPIRRGPVNAAEVSRRANRALRSLGIPDTMHSLRHWCGTTAWRRSHDLRAVQELLRHRSPTATAGYVAVSPDHLAGLAEAVAAQ